MKPSALAVAVALALPPAVLLPAAAVHAAEPARVEIKAVDGLQLGATYFAASAPGPGVLLLHQCNRDRSSWTGLAARLADAGMHVLTMDFRGFGESTNERVGTFAEHSAELWPAWDDDVDRALSFLESLPGVDAKHIGVMGASCGGSQALLVALRHPEIRAAGFLSSSLPWLEEPDVDAFVQDSAVAVLAISAEGDAGSTAAAHRLFTASANDASRLIVTKGRAHGVPLFEQDPSLPDAIVSWFAATLR
jgi:dienelactone hydrolase